MSTIDPPRPADAARIDSLEREVRGYRVSRDGWTLVIFVLAASAIIAATIAIGVAATRDVTGTTAVAADQAITADLSEYKITLSTDDVTKAGTVSINNQGTMVHNLSVVGQDLTSADIQPGGTGTLDLSRLAAGTYQLVCLIPGHSSSGMVSQLTVGGGGTASPAAEHGEHTMTAAEAAQMDEKMMDSIAAFPAATQGAGNQLLAPTVLADGSKHFALTAAVIDWEVTPGTTVKAWAYNGMVPGPRINVAVGDTVEITLTNDLPLGTDIHWHGIETPNDQDGVAPLTQDLIKPGTTYTYRFTVNGPEIGMYHAHAHGDLQVPNGLFGAFYVGEVPMPTGRTVSGVDMPTELTISQDITMVVNDAGTIGLTLNGKGFPATEPYTATVGDWIKVTYFNEGLQAHPMHLHGFPQIVYAKDGYALDQPYAADTILVAPGERYTVLVHADRPGTWVWHCHILNHVEGTDGMFGMVTALIVNPR